MVVSVGEMIQRQIVSVLAAGTVIFPLTSVNVNVSHAAVEIICHIIIRAIRKGFNVPCIFSSVRSFCALTIRHMDIHETIFVKSQ